MCCHVATALVACFHCQDVKNATLLVLPLYLLANGSTFAQTLSKISRKSLPKPEMANITIRELLLV